MKRTDTFILGELIAHLRSYTDIPFAKEIAHFANTTSIYTEFKSKRSDIPELAARYEVRFKSVTAVASAYGNNQILEIASGLSSRGMYLTAEAHVAYVETDMRAAANTKREIVKKILQAQKIIRPNLTINPANALNFDELYQNAALLTQPLTIICEGLLSNLPYPGLCSVMANILRLLNESGGVLITPDFFNREQRKQSLANKNSAYTFDSDDDIFAFIKTSGFSFNRYLQREVVPHLSCRLEFDQIKVRRQLENRYVYALVAR